MLCSTPEYEKKRMQKNIILKIPAVLAAGFFALSVIKVNAYANMNTLIQASTPLLQNIPNRTANIILTCRMINETVLAPGEIFSFNQAVGVRTESRGFKPAPSFAEGHVEDTVGGGICQVSSTLYIACLLANLEIISRTNHSMITDYIKEPGLDAAVSWGSIDYTFRNSTGSPIIIFAWADAEAVYVKLDGVKTNDYSVRIESKILSVTPYDTVYRVNRALKPGQKKVIQEPHTGYAVKTYRVIHDAKGNLISRTLEATSIYNKTDEIIEYNPSSLDITTSAIFMMTTNNNIKAVITTPAETNNNPEGSICLRNLLYQPF